MNHCLKAVVLRGLSGRLIVIRRGYSGDSGLSNRPLDPECLLALSNKRMHPTWRGHGLALGGHLPWIAVWNSVLCRATQVMRGR